MGLEIEAKLKVDSHDAIRATLADAQARCVGQVLESNVLFDHPDGSLRAKGCGLRVRSCVALAGETPMPTITYKGPRQASPFKCREEIEITVDDAAQTQAMLESIGLALILVFEKRRESWQLDDCLIELDEVPYLGTFVEIEGPNEQQIHRMQDRLGLSGRALIRNSYIALLVDYCKHHGLPISSITFEQANAT